MSRCTYAASNSSRPVLFGGSAREVRLGEQLVDHRLQHAAARGEAAVRRRSAVDGSSRAHHGVDHADAGAGVEGAHAGQRAVGRDDGDVADAADVLQRAPARRRRRAARRRSGRAARPALPRRRRARGSRSPRRAPCARRSPPARRAARWSGRARARASARASRWRARRRARRRPRRARRRAASASQSPKSTARRQYSRADPSRIAASMRSRCAGVYACTWKPSSSTR